jgi:membrane protein DedA with SNARE-associated domain
MTFNKSNKRWLIILLNIIVVLIIFYLLIGESINSREPPDTISFAFIVFAGYLFFIIMPVEVAFIYFAETGDMNIGLLIAMTVTLAMISQSLDYTVGHHASASTIQKLVSPGRFAKAKSFLQRYGKIIIFLFNTLPLSSPILSLAAGVLNYPFRNVFFISASGLVIKYSVIAIFLSAKW